MLTVSSNQGRSCNNGEGTQHVKLWHALHQKHIMNEPRDIWSTTLIVQLTENKFWEESFRFFSETPSSWPFGRNIFLHFLFLFSSLFHVLFRFTFNCAHLLITLEWLIKWLLEWLFSQLSWGKLNEAWEWERNPHYIWVCKWKVAQNQSNCTMNQPKLCNANVNFESLCFVWLLHSHQLRIDLFVLTKRH